jgi:hypothetical protein
LIRQYGSEFCELGVGQLARQTLLEPSPVPLADEAVAAPVVGPYAFYQVTALAVAFHSFASAVVTADGSTGTNCSRMDGGVFLQPQHTTVLSVDSIHLSEPHWVHW